LKRWTIIVVGFLAVAAPAAASAPLVGTFATTISGAKPAPLNGSWTLQFLANGAYEIDRNALAVVIGHSTASAAKIVFANETGPFACKPAGKYRWALRGKKLTMKALQDSCTGRRTVLTSHALIKQ
jgi:hypothetical protein